MDKEKKIDVGSSSLVDLKAELHRKQQESRTLRGRTDLPPKSSGGSKVWAKSNAGVEKRDQRDSEEVAREVKDLDRSRMALEAKARLYDKLQTGTDALQDDATNERFLVNFQQKVIDDVTQRRQRRQAAEEETAEPPAGPVSAEDEWVEYTDSLGRSRTVMRRDLAEYKRRDRERKETTDSQLSQGAGLELVSEDQRREQQRQLWEQQEQDNAAKRDIHYQDVLFDEARSHGAGYFAFSQDSEERARQRSELDELRERTETQQSRAELARKRKNKQLKERLRKVRERKRLKLGLPIEDRLEREESEDEQETAPAAPPEPTPDELKKREEDDKKEEERQRFIREWDLGKEGVSKKSLLTQEQWVEQQRTDRPAEFAPPAQYEPRGRGRRAGPLARDAGRGRPAAAATAARPAEGTEGDRTRSGGGVTDGTADSAGSYRSAGQESAAANTHRSPSNEQRLPALGMGQIPPNTVQEPPIMGQAPLSMGQAPTDMGQAPPILGKVPLDMGRMPPNMGQAPPDMGQAPPDMGRAPPGMGQTPNVGQASDMGQMLPNMGQMPPSMGQMPPNMKDMPPSTWQMPPNVGYFPPYIGQAPPNMGTMPLSMAQMLPNMGQPPPAPGQFSSQSGQFLGSARQPAHNTGMPSATVTSLHPSTPSSETAGSAAADAGQYPAGLSRPAPFPPLSGRPGAAGPARGRRAASYRARQAAAADLTDPDCVPPEEEEDARGAAAEVAPPLTAEYFGGARRGRRQTAARPDVGSAIEAGLALLSEDTEKKHSKTFDV